MKGGACDFLSAHPSAPVCVVYRDPCRAVASHLELIFINMQHLAARLRHNEALARLLQEHEDIVTQANALIAKSNSKQGSTVAS